MNIHEYQAKEVLKGYGVRIQEGIVASSPEEAHEAAVKLNAQTGTSWFVIKAQIHAGGRGKGEVKETGSRGVVLAKKLEDVKEKSAAILGGTLVTKYSGYSIPRVFYSPKYEENSPTNRLTDRRATLYWNPLIKTDQSGKASLSYFNSETASRHLLILEGIDSQGRLGRLVKVIE